MTAKKPRQPPTLWVDGLIYWAPVPGCDPPQDPYEQTVQGALVYRTAGLWTYYPDNPPGVITHTIDEATGQLATTLDLQAPTPNYQPFPEAETLQPCPVAWTPYDSGPVHMIGQGPNPTETMATLLFQQLSPAARVAPAIAATPRPTGPYGTRVLERRPFGPRQRAKAEERDRPTARQAAINTNFQTAAQFWTDMQPEERTAWGHAARIDKRSGKGYSLYLAIALGTPSDRKQSLERRLGVHLSTPADP